MKKRVFITLFLILILIANLSFASYETVTMTVVEEPVCTIEIGENSNFSKEFLIFFLLFHKNGLQILFWS